LHPAGGPIVEVVVRKHFIHDCGVILLASYAWVACAIYDIKTKAWLSD